MNTRFDVKTVIKRTLFKKKTRQAGAGKSVFLNAHCTRGRARIKSINKESRLESTPLKD